MEPVIKIGTTLSIGTVVEITADSVIVENNGKRVKISHRVAEGLAGKNGSK